MSTRPQGVQQTVEGRVQGCRALLGSHPSDVIQMEGPFGGQALDPVYELQTFKSIPAVTGFVVRAPMPSQ